MINKTFGTILKNNPIVYKDSLQYRTITSDIDIVLPDNFDGRKVWRNYLSTPIRNQGKCGNCWAQSTCNMLEDRFLIQTRGKISLIDDLSATHLTICEYQRDLDYISLRNSLSKQEEASAEGHSKGACHGNSLYNAAEFLYLFGVPDSSCIGSKNFDTWCQKLPKPCKDLNTYVNDTDLPTCEQLLGLDYDTCLDGTTGVKRYRSIAIYNVPRDEKSIMYEIFRWGPVSCGFLVYNDFLEYDGKGKY